MTKHHLYKNWYHLLNTLPVTGIFMTLQFPVKYPTLPMSHFLKSLMENRKFYEENICEIMFKYTISLKSYVHLKGNLEVFLNEHLLNRIQLTYSVYGTLSTIIIRHYYYYLILFLLYYFIRITQYPLNFLMPGDTHPDPMCLLYFLPIDLPYVYLDICFSLKNIFCCFINNIFENTGIVLYYKFNLWLFLFKIWT